MARSEGGHTVSVMAGDCQEGSGVEASLDLAGDGGELLIGEALEANDPFDVEFG